LCILAPRPHNNPAAVASAPIIHKTVAQSGAGVKVQPANKNADGTAPGPVSATGVDFNATTYQVVGNYITGGFVNAPTTRSRQLCPYPQQARFTGSTTMVNGIPVAANPTDLANASMYKCIQPVTN